MEPNVEIKAEANLTEPIKQVTERVVLPPTAEVSKGITKLLSVVTTFIDNVTYKYIANSEMKKKKFLEELEKKYNSIPEESLKEPNINLSALMCNERLSIDADARVNDGDILHVGNLEFRVIHTPGHTRGGSSLYCESENLVFAGDTLFKGMWGRTDLPTSNFNEIINSINNKLLVLPGDTIVYPGHGISTQIQEEEPIDENLLLED